MKKRPIIGLVLGGGAARGFSHLGVIKILEKNKIPIDMISGTSIGAVIGAAYALNPNIKEVIPKIRDFKILYPSDFSIQLDGLVKGKRIEQFISKMLNGKNFNDVKIPLYINTVDLNTEREIIFSKGDLVKAIRSSLSIPGIIAPVKDKGMLLVDGALINNLQVDILRKKGADIIITVNLFPNHEHKYVENKYGNKKKNKVYLKENIISIFNKTIHLLISENISVINAKKSSDFFIEPNIGQISWFDFKKREKLIKLGETAAKKQIKAIKKAVFR